MLKNGSDHWYHCGAFWINQLGFFIHGGNKMDPWGQTSAEGSDWNSFLTIICTMIESQNANIILVCFPRRVHHTA
jgi:hypothetical protein